ncbi:MAG: FAD-dependent oxidoreductase [Actinobacteria bacterium]|nr:FAD-dependent oxidoreductase [Actinomycetota bacterium]
MDVSRYVRCISEVRFDEALDVIRENNPFPTVCGRVCFHPCETKCRRGQIDDPIAIRALKRLVAERADRKKFILNVESKKTGKRVAIVGSGPAGLTAGYYLARIGHEVTIFESLPVVGGMLRTAIPEFRLPRHIVDMDIRDIERAGVTIKTNSPIRSVLELKSQGYDAVFLALGAQAGIKGNIPGSDDPMVFDCLDLLRRLNLGGKSIDLGKKIMVVGGGNAAMDMARTAIRIGAEDVLVIYRRTRLEMTAEEEEVKQALTEGVHIEFLTSPVMIERQDGKLMVKCVKMKLGPVDRSGRPSPQPIAESEFWIAADSVIMSIGQAVILPESMECNVDKLNRIIVDEFTLETSQKGVFAGGDVVTGPASIVEAIGAGKLAAISIDRYLGGNGDVLQGLGVPETSTPKPVDMPEGEQPRIELPMRATKSRIKDWEEVEIGYDEEMAVKEANRCLRCDLEELG